MKEKRVLFLFLFLIILQSTSFLIAAVDQKEVDKSYDCLKNLIGPDCDKTENVENAAFNLLAMAYDSDYQSKCKSSLIAKKNSDCWGGKLSATCDLKSTSLAILALHNINDAPKDSIDWILSKRDLKTGLTWFLEIDAMNFTECDINGKKIFIAENKKISGPDPQGLSKTFNSYWYEITSIGKNYTISCDIDFVTTLLYKKPGSSVLYVSSDTHYASAHDSTVETVNSYCFKIGSECNYEGSLWATLALARVGEDISPYLPYLSSMADETANKKFMPMAFLCMLTGADDYCGEVREMQEQNKFWDQSRRKLYDTSLAMLALNKLNLDEVENAKEYLIEIRDQEGCWGVDTSMILFSGWPKSPTSGGGTGSGNLPPGCENSNFFCVASGECEIENQLDNYYCEMSDGTTCCNKEPKKQTCAEKNGFACDANQECNGKEESADDTRYCCIGACQEKVVSNDCETAGGICKSSCLPTEQEKKGDYSQYCNNFGDKCCEKIPVTQSSYKWLIILLLIILVILLILAVIFRNQLRIWMFRFKSSYKSDKGPSQANRPTGPPPPGGFRGMPPQRPGIRQAPHLYHGNIRRPVGKAEDKDYEETMRKLRDMTK